MLLTVAIEADRGGLLQPKHNGESEDERGVYEHVQVRALWDLCPANPTQGNPGFASYNYFELFAKRIRSLDNRLYNPCPVSRLSCQTMPVSVLSAVSHGTTRIGVLLLRFHLTSPPKSVEECPMGL